MKRSSVRMLSAFRIACSMAGEMEMPSSGGAFERIAVNPFDGIRRKNSGDAAVKRCTHGINVLSRVPDFHGKSIAPPGHSHALE